MTTDTQTVEDIDTELARLQKLKEQKLEASKAVDLETVKKLCKQHGFTATNLRGFLATKGKGKTVAKKKPAAKKTTSKKS
ncbi:MAG: hypothetical protein EBT02_10945 [Planctomycetia bacterium]|nr:hypothetical protein [Planctomycetia bacterium]